MRSRNSPKVTVKIPDLPLNSAPRVMWTVSIFGGDNGVIDRMKCTTGSLNASGTFLFQNPN